MRWGRSGAVVTGRVRAVQEEASESARERLRAGLDAVCTLQAAKVTFVGVARLRGAEGTLALGPQTVRFLRASQCQDEAHYHLLLLIGATPTTTTFAIPAPSLADRAGFLRTLITLEGIAVGAAMAMTRRFAELGEHRLVEIAFQMGAVDAQHEALARQLLGLVPPNDRAFARWRFVDLAEVGAALTESGFLDDAEETFAFPGPVDRNCAGVFGLVPTTTEDALLPPPPVGTPLPEP